MKTYIWSVPTRSFHWLMVIGLVGAYVLGEEESNMNIHSAFGYMVATLVLFRLLWGFVGPKYSRFKDFPVSKKSLVEFFTNMKASKDKYPGHNPAASLVMLVILVVVLVVSFTGILALAAEGNGPIRFLNIGKTDFYKELHEAFVNILIALVILHLIGILADRFLHGNSRTLFSMFTGYKALSGDGIKLNSFQKIFSTLFIFTAIGLFVIGVTMQNLPKEEKKSDYEKKEFHIEKDGD